MKKGKIPILCGLHSWYVKRKGIRSVNPIETVQLDLLEMGAYSLPSLPPTGLCCIYFLFLSLHHGLSTPYIFLVPQSTPVPKLHDFLAHIPTMSPSVSLSSNSWKNLTDHCYGQLALDQESTSNSTSFTWRKRRLWSTWIPPRGCGQDIISSKVWQKYTNFSGQFNNTV